MSDKQKKAEIPAQSECNGLLDAVKWSKKLLDGLQTATSDCWGYDEEWDYIRSTLEKILKTPQQCSGHQTQHVHLHNAVTELFTDYVKQHPGSKGINITMHDFLTWSVNQVDHEPDHPEAFVVIRRGD